MDVLNSSVFRFFKDFEKRAETFYYHDVKGHFYSFKLKLKIRSLLKPELGKKLSGVQKKEIRDYYRNYKIKNVTTEWHSFYSGCNNIFSAEYIPENLFYVKIEPFLNTGIFYPALADKNLLDRLFSNVKQPETIIKNCNGFFYSKGKVISIGEAVERCKTSEKMIIKPTIDTWGGNDVLLFSGYTGNQKNDKSIAALFRSYKKNFIVQKVLEQHSIMSGLNSTSLNTLRVMTYMEGTTISILSVVVRMGKKGAFTDNASMGGISCGVKADGELNEIGFESTGKRATTTDGGTQLKDIKLPFMEKVTDTVTKLHLGMPYFRVISWDLAVDVSGDIVLIEHNVNGQGINIHQLNNGPVLGKLVQGYSYGKTVLT